MVLESAFLGDVGGEAAPGSLDLESAFLGDVGGEAAFGFPAAAEVFLATLPPEASLTTRDAGLDGGLPPVEDAGLPPPVGDAVLLLAEDMLPVLD